MLFHTPAFLLFFVLFVPTYLTLRRWSLGPLVLLVFSQIFYGWWDWRFLILLWITILFDYGVALLLARSTIEWHRKVLLGVSIAASLSLLGFFKYWNFLVGSASQWTGQAASALSVPNLILPVGISFYTFQSMSYVVDVYRRQEKPITNLLHYAVFVCYFPHLVAGPIQRLHQLLPQILRPGPVTTGRVLSGLALFSYGLLSKALGDLLATLNDPVFRDISAAEPSAVVLAIFGFGLQIYFDFSGYTEMARGVSRILGIELMRNFRAPYLSTSFREFWRRWHISLSEWLRDYLYIPLGGNRRPLPVQLRNLMITMLLGGLWHGAGWNFVIWGGLHGLYLALNTLVNRLPLNLERLGPARSVLGWAITYVGVNYAWLYFRIATFDDALIANQKIVQWLTEVRLPTIPWQLLLLLSVILVVDAIRRRHYDLFPQQIESPRLSATLGLISGCFIVAAIVLLAGRPTLQFIYFQF